ncbi:MAG: hypothetical protein J5I98_19885 [Phaeodactylibacter sp.]|nr:hypothetical protein [Phaeodactylibacter sp.]
MEQFSNFTFIKQIAPETIGSKFNMSYRLKCLLAKEIDLAKYGKAVQFISFSPIIGEVFPPISEYIPSEKTLEVQYLIAPQQAIEADEAQFFRLMLEQFIAAMEEMELPEDFDFSLFREDLKALRFEQLQPAV